MENGLDKTGQQYYEHFQPESTPFRVEGETQSTSLITIRPGLINKIIAAGVSLEKDRDIVYETSAGPQIMTPAEAQKLLTSKVRDIIELPVTAQEYFDNISGEAFTILKESEHALEIDIRPGLIGIAVAAGVAKKNGKLVTYTDWTGKRNLFPDEAPEILSQPLPSD